MPYTDPDDIHVPTVGDIAPAAWGTAVRDAVDYANRGMPRCRTRLSAPIVISNAIATALPMNLEDYDIGGMHSTSSNPERHYAPSLEAGFYRFSLYPVWEIQTPASGIRRGLIKAGGVSVVADEIGVAYSGYSHQLSITGSCYVAAGGWVEPWVLHDAGADLVLNGAIFEIGKEASE